MDPNQNYPPGGGGPGGGGYPYPPPIPFSNHGQQYPQYPPQPPVPNPFGGRIHPTWMAMGVLAPPMAQMPPIPPIPPVPVAQPAPVNPMPADFFRDAPDLFMGPFNAPAPEQFQQAGNQPLIAQPPRPYHMVLAENEPQDGRPFHIVQAENQMNQNANDNQRQFMEQMDREVQQMREARERRRKEEEAREHDATMATVQEAIRRQKEEDDAHQARVAEHQATMAVVREAVKRRQMLEEERKRLAAETAMEEVLPGVIRKPSSLIPPGLGGRDNEANHNPIIDIPEPITYHNTDLTTLDTGRLCKYGRELVDEFLLLTSQLTILLKKVMERRPLCRGENPNELSAHCRFNLETMSEIREIIEKRRKPSWKRLSGDDYIEMMLDETELAKPMTEERRKKRESLENQFPSKLSPTPPNPGDVWYKGRWISKGLHQKYMKFEGNKALLASLSHQLKALAWKIGVTNPLELKTIDLTESRKTRRNYEEPEDDV